jgi:Na+-transporting NADH:ubiquinone oxidoreductase subunit C
MAMNKESNGYVFGFAIVLVIVVGSILAFLAMFLKDTISSNVRNEKMMNIIEQ